MTDDSWPRLASYQMTSPSKECPQSVWGSPPPQILHNFSHLSGVSQRRHSSLQFLWVVFSRAKLSKVVDDSELDNCQDDVHVGDEEEDVQGSRVRYFWQILPGFKSKECHCQHRRNSWILDINPLPVQQMLVFPTQSYSVRSCLPVEPEGNPGDDNNQDARAVHLWFIIITNKKVLTWKSLDFYSRYTWMTKSPMCLRRWKCTMSDECFSKIFHCRTLIMSLCDYVCTSHLCWRWVCGWC